MNDYITVQEAAARLGMSIKWVYKMVHDPDSEKRIPAARFGSRIKIIASKLDDYKARAEEIMTPSPLPPPPERRRRQGKPPVVAGAKKITYDPKKPFRVQDYY